MSRALIIGDHVIHTVARMKAIGITILLLSVVCSSIIFSCGKDGGKPAHDKAYELLETATELNANGNKQAALNTIDSALAMRPADSTRCWLMSEKTVALLDMGQMEKAIGHGKQTLELAEEIGDVEAILNMRGTLGIAYRRSGKLDSAIVEYEKGIELALKEKNTEYEIYLDNCMAVLYSENNRFKEALAYAMKAERAAAAANDTIERLSANANIGGIYLRQNKPQKALDAMLPAWDDVLAADYNVLTMKHLSIILKSYLLLGDMKKMEHYMRYADTLVPTMPPASNGVLGILETKAYMLGREGRYKQQLVLLDSIAAMNATNLTMPEERLLNERAKCLAALGRTDEAYNVMKEAFTELDSVKQSDVEKGMNELAAKYNTLEKEMNIEQMKREKAELNNRILWLAVTVAVLAVVVCILLYRRKLARRKAELQEKCSFISGMENERERMAKELHDGVCNDLLATTLLLATDTERAERQLRSVWRDVRHLSHALMPPRFGKVALNDAVASYAASVSEDSGRKISLGIDSQFDWHSLPQQKAYETYRIIQEAMANAVKHSSTGDIVVSLSHADNGYVVAKVANDVSAGDEPCKSGGLGMETMRRRANTIGARLEMKPENGLFTLTLTFKS